MSLSAHELAVSIAGKQVVSDLDFAPAAGEFWAVLGPNGIGKTTLLKSLAGLHAPDAGEVRLDGQPLRLLPRRAVARRLGMLQQHTAYAFDASVLETVLTGRHPHLSHWAREGPRDIALAREALAQVDLEGLEQRSVTGLSGGEARRVACAALLVQQTDVMLLDEPTNHLDLRHQLALMSLLRGQVRDEGRTAVCAMHEINLAARFCSHVLMLFGDGQWCAGRCGDMLSESALERLYGCPVRAVQTEDGTRFLPAGGASPVAVSPDSRNAS